MGLSLQSLVAIAGNVDKPWAFSYRPGRRCDWPSSCCPTHYRTVWGPCPWSWTRPLAQQQKRLWSSMCLSLRPVTLSWVLSQHLGALPGTLFPGAKTTHLGFIQSPIMAQPCVLHSLSPWPVGVTAWLSSSNLSTMFPTPLGLMGPLPTSTTPSTLKQLDKAIGGWLLGLDGAPVYHRPLNQWRSPWITGFIHTCRGISPLVDLLYMPCCSPHWSSTQVKYRVFSWNFSSSYKRMR